MGANIQDIPNSYLTKEEYNEMLKAYPIIYEPNKDTKLNVMSGKYKGYYLVNSKAKDLMNRFDKFKKAYGREPNYIAIVEAPTGTQIAGPIERYIKQITRWSFKTPKEFVDKCRGIGYSNYLNNKSISLEKAIARLGKDGLNCVEYTLIAYSLFKEWGYNVETVQINCQKNTHLVLRYWRTGQTKTWLDLSAIASKNESRVEIGEIRWCRNPNGKGLEIVAIDPTWMKNLYKDDLLK